MTTWKCSECGSSWYNNHHGSGQSMKQHLRDRECPKCKSIANTNTWGMSK